MSRHHLDSTLLCEAMNNALNSPFMAFVTLDVNGEITSPSLFSYTHKLKLIVSLFYLYFALSLYGITPTHAFISFPFSPSCLTHMARLPVFPTVPPVGVEVTVGATEIHEGDTVVLYCVARGAKPAASLTWLNGSTPLGDVETVINVEVRVIFFFF